MCPYIRQDHRSYHLVVIQHGSHIVYIIHYILFLHLYFHILKSDYIMRNLL